MMIFFITLLVFSAVIALMAVGLLAGRHPIRRGCGGSGNTGISQRRCEHCSRRKCPKSGGTAKAIKESSHDK